MRQANKNKPNVTAVFLGFTTAWTNDKYLDNFLQCGLRVILGNQVTHFWSAVGNVLYDTVIYSKPMLITLT